MRRRFPLAASTALVLGLSVAVPLRASQPLPTPTGRISDFGNVLDERVETELDLVLKATEEKTTAQLAVVTVPSLQGMTVEDYAERLFRQWGIGQAGVDNGVLVLVAPREREMRIEVGYGLEGVLPDGLAGEIVRTNFIPHFRDNDYAGGIEEGVRRIAGIVERNHVLTESERQALAASAEERPPMWLMVPFLGLFVTIGFFMIGLGLGSKTGFPLLFGSLFGAIPMTFSLIPFFNAPFWIMGTLALVMGLAGYRQGRTGGGLAATFRDGAGATGTGWVMGGRSSSSGSGSDWSSGSSSSGGGFGGGSSGGGGASGR
ncbi:MAG: TPM domain-containing protein, partial [Acidobacteriota bacterium]|nr:TPM domain-containing protein [Acidobacteriota bacterium]